MPELQIDPLVGISRLGEGAEGALLPPVGVISSAGRNATGMSVGRLRIRPTREGVIYGVMLVMLLASAIANQINLLVLLFGLMAGPLLFSVFFALYSLRGVTVVRRSPSRVEAGEWFVVELLLTRPRRLGGAWGIAVDDRLVLTSPRAADQTAFNPQAWFLYARSGGTTAGGYRGLITRRGCYRFGRLKLSTRFPLGLIEVSRTFSQPAELLVTPRLGRMNRSGGHSPSPRGPAQGASRIASAGGDEFHSLRDFRPGDNPRWIHWRTSARQRELMVREFEATQHVHLAIVLDIWTPPQPTTRERDLVELAISVAATLCGEACREGGARLSFVAAGEQIEVVQGLASHSLWHRVLDRLAVTGPGTRDFDLRQWLQRARREAQEAQGIVVVTTRPAPDDDDGERPSPSWRDRRQRFVRVSQPSLAEHYQMR